MSSGQHFQSLDCNGCMCLQPAPLTRVLAPFYNGDPVAMAHLRRQSLSLSGHPLPLGIRSVMCPVVVRAEAAWSPCGEAAHTHPLVSWSLHLPRTPKRRWRASPPISPPTPQPGPTRAPGQLGSGNDSCISKERHKVSLSHRQKPLLVVLFLLIYWCYELSYQISS